MGVNHLTGPKVFPSIKERRTRGRKVMNDEKRNQKKTPRREYQREARDGQPTTVPPIPAGEGSRQAEGKRGSRVKGKSRPWTSQ